MTLKCGKKKKKRGTRGAAKIHSFCSFPLFGTAVLTNHIPLFIETSTLLKDMIK